jgi:hypothetical protein
MPMMWASKFPSLVPAQKHCATSKIISLVLRMLLRLEAWSMKGNLSAFVELYIHPGQIPAFGNNASNLFTTGPSFSISISFLINLHLAPILPFCFLLLVLLFL